MATDRDVIKALNSAAQALTGRQTNASDEERLIEAFNQTTGDNYNKAIVALCKVTNLDEIAINKKSSSSDDTSRVLEDLRRTLENWTPKG